MTSDRIARILNNYRVGIYSPHSAKRELIAIGFTPAEAADILSPASPKSAVENPAVPSAVSDEEGR